MEARNPYQRPAKRQVSRNAAKAKREYLTMLELRDVAPKTITSCRGFVARPEKGETRLVGADHDAENLRRAMEVYIRKDNTPQLF